MSNVTATQALSLDQQLQEFRQRRFLATPLSGAIVWFILIFTGLFLPSKAQVLAVFVGTGSIVYLALLVSRFTGERLKFQSNKQRNFFDTLFLSTVAMSFFGVCNRITVFCTKLQSAALCRCRADRFDVAADERHDPALDRRISRGGAYRFVYLGVGLLSRT